MTLTEIAILAAAKWQHIRESHRMAAQARRARQRRRAEELRKHNFVGELLSSSISRTTTSTGRRHH